MSRFVEILIELQKIVADAEVPMTLTFEPGWSEPVLEMRQLVSTACPITQPEVLYRFLQKK
jgi:hypothetical protein